MQKGNAPEERKLQRLFRNPEASRLIKRCNDFGAGGVSVAIGELADGLHIDLDAVPKKYEGLDGTELAISESQERMAVVVAAGDVDKFLALAACAKTSRPPWWPQVTDDPRVTMTWNGDVIVDLSREFLNSNGASKHTMAVLPPRQSPSPGKSRERLRRAACAVWPTTSTSVPKQGLAERFDSHHRGGHRAHALWRQLSAAPPFRRWRHKISRVQGDDTMTCSLMAWGFNPHVSEKSPFHGAYLAVVESVSKLVAAGAGLAEHATSTFQEYFEKLGHGRRRAGASLWPPCWARYKAQIELRACLHRRQGLHERQL